MASTRIRDDLGRKQEQLQHSIYACNYAINAPGNGGTTPDYMEDPHIRAQVGANLMTNAVDLESSLKGIRPLSHDCLGKDSMQNTHPILNHNNIQAMIHYIQNNLVPLLQLGK